MKTAIYLRKSRAEELTDSVEDTLRRHRETLLCVAQKKELDIADIYEEVVSGENLHTRLEMLRMLQAVTDHRYEAILCMDIDRLGRGSMSQQGIILETLKSAGVLIITPQKTYDLNNDMDEEYSEFQSFFARRELKTIKKRMHRGIEKTIEEGGYLSNAPYGYHKCRSGKLPSLSVNEEEAEFIRMIFDLYVNKHYGCQTIAGILNQTGASPRRGGAFSRSAVMAILKNPVYIGKIAWNRYHYSRPNEKQNKYKKRLNPEEMWVLTKGIHPPIISEGLYEKAQELIKGRYHPPSFSGSLSNPLAGIITCSQCGKKLQRRASPKNKTVYLLCPSAGCIPSCSLEEAENALFAAVRDQLSKIELKSTYIQEEQSTQTKDLLAFVYRELSQLKKQQDRLHELLEQGTYTTETFQRRTEQLSQRRKKLENTKDMLLLETKKEAEKNLLLSPMETVLDAYENGTVNEKNALLKAVISEAVYYKEAEWERGQFVLNIKLKAF